MATGFLNMIGFKKKKTFVESQSLMTDKWVHE